jgi:hypothetical protein
MVRAKHSYPSVRGVESLKTHQGLYPPGAFTQSYPAALFGPVRAAELSASGVKRAAGRGLALRAMLSAVGQEDEVRLPDSARRPTPRRLGALGGRKGVGVGTPARAGIWIGAQAVLHRAVGASRRSIDAPVRANASRGAPSRARVPTAAAGTLPGRAGRPAALPRRAAVSSRAGRPAALPRRAAVSGRAPGASPTGCSATRASTTRACAAAARAPAACAPRAARPANSRRAATPSRNAHEAEPDQHRRRSQQTPGQVSGTAVVSLHWQRRLHSYRGMSTAAGQNQAPTPSIGGSGSEKSSESDPDRARG